MDNLIILSGNSNVPLAERIANKLNVEFRKDNIPTMFANTEYHSRIHSNLRGKDVFIVNTGYVNNELHMSVNDIIFETLLLVDACRRSMASSVNIIMPNFPYARGDKKDEPRAPIPAKLVCNLFSSIKVDRFVSVDLHSTQIQGFMDVPFDNLYSSNLIINRLTEDLFKDYTLEQMQERFIVVAPDAGASKKTLLFSSRLKLNTIIMHKQRSYSKKSTIERTFIVQENGLKDYQNKTAIIIDDLADTCGTLVTAANTLHKNGLKDIICVLTHGIFSKDAIAKINKCPHIKTIYVSDSIPQEKNLTLCDKLKVYTLSDLLADCIKRITLRNPISELFAF